MRGLAPLRIGSPPVEILLKPDRRARRLVLRVSSVTGKATLTVPPGLSRREAERFVAGQEGWLKEKLASLSPPILPALGGLVPIEGEMVRLEAARRGITRDGDRLSLGGAPQAVPARLKAYLQMLARDRLVEASGRYAAALGRTHGRITLRDTRSRWGSCSEDGNLMFSWRLIMAPPEVLDYVAAHEAAHLVEMNHSPEFWKLVARLRPDYVGSRDWLRAHGTGLHRYRFQAS